MHKQHNWKVQGTPPWSEETCYWSERGREVTCGLPEVDPTFKILLVKEQSVRHNCTSAAIKLKTPTINGCWEKIGQDCQNKNKTNGEKKKNTKCPRRTIISLGMVLASTSEPALYNHEVGGCCPWGELIQMLHASVLPQRVFILKLTDVIRGTIVNHRLYSIFIFLWRCS